MRRAELLAALVVGLLLGAVIVAAALLQNKSPHPVTPRSATPLQSASAVIRTPTPTPIPSAVAPAATLTPSGPPLLEADPPGTDAPDVLLLFNPARASSFGTNFCRLAEFYGLVCTQFNVTQRDTLTAADLLGPQGLPYPLIALDATLLDNRSPLLSSGDLEVLMEAVNQQGVSVLVGKLDDLQNADLVSALTAGAVAGVTRPEDTTKDWQVSRLAPEITLELTGQNIITSQAATPDTFALNIVDPLPVTVLISSTDNSGASYPIFLRWQPSDQPAAGAVYLDSGETGQSLDFIALREVYYSAASFSQIIPTMLTLRHVMGEETWHAPQDFANLTIDEGALLEPYQDLNYTALLELMRRNSYHTTLALIPQNWQLSESEVVALFLTAPDYFSLAQYGNTGAGYEFYRYATPAPDATDVPLLPARPLDDQQRSILEGLARMQLHENLTRVPFDRIMIFPGGISPVQTLEFLKANNYLATVNTQDLPLDAVRPTNWDYGMTPAITDFAGFPNLIRRMPTENQAYQPYVLASILDLLVDKPALFYTYPYGSGLFSAGMDAFDSIAGKMNALEGEVSWRSLGEIAKRLCRIKRDDDGTVSVQMYTRWLILANPDATDTVFHITKSEPLNVPIVRLTVNGYAFPYTIQDGSLTLNLIIPAQSSAEIIIEYSQPAE